MLPESENNHQSKSFDELEAAYRTITTQQKILIDASPGPPPDVDHKLNYFKVKTLWRAYTVFTKLRQNKKKLIVITSPLVLIIGLFIIYSVFLPKTLVYNFASTDNCLSSPIFFSGLFKTSSNEFYLKRSSTELDGFKVYSSGLCVKPRLSPKPSTDYSEKEWLSFFGLRFSKSITIKTTSYPLANAGTLGTTAIPIQRPLQFKLSSDDLTFSYDLSANGQIAPCLKTGTSLSCSLTPLKLSYGAGYGVSLVRVFNNQVVDTAISKKIQTVTATAITQTSIVAGSTAYNKPQQVVLTTSKPLTTLETVSLTYKNASGLVTTIPTTPSFKSNQITVDWTPQLPRQTSFDLHISNVSAIDYSTLEQPYDLTFSTSGGPQVTGSNIPLYGLSSGQSMRVSLSQSLDPGQNFASLVSLIVNGQSEPASVTLTGSQALTITPTTGYPVCATVKVEFSGNAENSYDVSGNSTWSYTTRSHCYSTFSIGTSVDGRQITAYQFGTGSSMVLFIAAMEGNEQNSANLLQQWIPNIDANPGKIPSYRTIVVIPQINPDGYAADTRLNAQGTDLNRNFPANNWSEQVSEPLANNVMTNDGGPYPLSAPESQTLANYYQAHTPRLTLTMHSHGGIVEANDAGDSILLGAQYARLADYRAIPTYEIGNFFNYTTTGAFEDWANNKLNLPVLEVELESATSDEYSRNLPALWAMAQVSP